MSVKKTTKTSSKIAETSKKRVASKTVSKKNTETDVKKVVVKRRKVELKPTKASAVAIASQANRAKKQALIERISNSEVIANKKIDTSDNKIPLWVRIFFGCALMFFCVSFYHAIVRPQIERGNVVVDDSAYRVDENMEEDGIAQEIENDNEISVEESSIGQVDLEKNQGVVVSKTAAIDVIEQFFVRLSDRDFDGAFDLMVPALRNYNDIRIHFTSFRMNPFLDGIEGGSLVPENFSYVSSSSNGKDIYEFDLSYVLKSNQEKYEEKWEFTVNTNQENPQILSIRCISSKCSYHPIFWPENFGLMR